MFALYPTTLNNNFNLFKKKKKKKKNKQTMAQIKPISPLSLTHKTIKQSPFLFPDSKNSP